MVAPEQTDRAVRYVLGEPIGAGGQGRTYRATDRESGRQVAVKVLTLRGAESWKPFDLFERECKVLRSLEHPGIPRFLDTYSIEDEGKYCLVMELVPGRSLQQQIDDGGSLGEGQLWNLLHQLLQILDYLHRRQPPVFHRDLKPANVIWRPDGSVALVDFGGVRVALRPEGGSTVVGTFGYLAPEQLHGQVNAATDIYGLGATLATLASGTPADRLPRRGLKIDLAQVMGDSKLRALLERMLEPDPDRRIGSVAEVRAAMGGAGPAAPPRSEPEPADERNAGTSMGGDEAVGPFVLRIIASLGYVGFVLLQTILLPLLFFALRRLSSSPKGRERLDRREERARRVLGDGRRVMGELADRRPVRKQLPPERGRRRRHKRGRRHLP